MATQRGRRQLQFTGAEMTLLAVSFMVTAACVFLLGFYVGKRNAAAHMPREARVARIPIDDLARFSRPATSRGQGTAEGRTSDGGAQASAAAAGRTAAEAKSGAGTRSDTAGGQGAAAASLKTVDAAARKPAEAAADQAKTAGAEGAGARPTAQAKAGEPGAGDKAAEARGSGAKAGEPKPAVDAKADQDERRIETGGYTVQVLATRKQSDAEALVKKLAARGYGAYVKRISDGQTSWYRVRVGRFGAFSDARSMADRCRRELGLEQAFVSTE